MASFIMDISMVRQAEISTVPTLAAAWENPRMADAKETLRARLRERLELMGKSPHALSKEIGANAGYVRDLLDPAKTSIPSAARLIALAGALGTTTEWLLGQADTPDQLHSEITVRDERLSWGHAELPGIPVLGTAFCDDLAIDGNGDPLRVERVLLEPDHTVRMVKRPAALWAARDAYAIDLLGDSMGDILPQGSTRIVDPRRPPSSGDFVVVQLNDGLGGRDVVTVLVKRLLRANSQVVELQQFNPPLTFTVPRSQVARMHRIVSYEELLN